MHWSSRTLIHISYERTKAASIFFFFFMSFVVCMCMYNGYKRGKWAALTQLSLQSRERARLTKFYALRVDNRMQKKFLRWEWITGTVMLCLQLKVDLFQMYTIHIFGGLSITNNFFLILFYWHNYSQSIRNFTKVTEQRIKGDGRCLTSDQLTDTPCSFYLYHWQKRNGEWLEFLRTANIKVTSKKHEAWSESESH